MKIRQRYYRALLWAVKEAEGWRGSLTGDPNPMTLAHFDLQCELAREALAALRKRPKRRKKT